METTSASGWALREHRVDSGKLSVRRRFDYRRGDQHDGSGEDPLLRARRRRVSGDRHDGRRFVARRLRWSNAGHGPADAQVDLAVQTLATDGRTNSMKVVILA